MPQGDKSEDLPADTDLFTASRIGHRNKTVWMRKEKRRRLLRQVLCLGVCMHAGAAWCAAQPPDTVHHLREVTVTGWQRRQAVIPARTLTAAEWGPLGTERVADALRCLAGVQLKDYGGIGGLKTVNVRSLGTEHTAVMYDGIAVDRAQNGQVDLGRFSLEGLEAVSLTDGQPLAALQPARAYASASAVALRSRRPTFQAGQRDGLRLSMTAGAADTYRPSLLWEHLLGRGVSSQVSAEYLTSSGRYRFHTARRDGYDTVRTRRNGDVSALRVETALYGATARDEWQARLYLYHSGRGLPGAVVREAPGGLGHEDRQWDTSLWAQAMWRRRCTRRYTLMVHGKAAYDYLHYESDRRPDAATLYADNHYRERSLYLSAAHLYTVCEGWTLSLATDAQYAHLGADLTDFVYPSRLTLYTAAATTLHRGGLSAQLSLLHTYVRDHIRRTGAASGSRRDLTPTVALAYTPIASRQTRWTLRTLYKRTFRMPTFTDLYYTFIGNQRLQPERATQYDVGMTLTHVGEGSILRRMEIRADGYYHRVRDKIVAMPTSNQFRWTMMNFGRCHILGADLSVATVWQAGGVTLTPRLTYAYTRARDVSDRRSAYYGGQLPYMPWHAATATLSAEWRGWSAGYTLIYTGERYESSANTADNYTQPWYTSDLSLSRLFSLGNCRLRASVEVSNLFDQRYEVVSCYPMPGTSLRVKLNFRI